MALVVRPGGSRPATPDAFKGIMTTTRSTLATPSTGAGAGRAPRTRPSSGGAAEQHSDTVSRERARVDEAEQLARALQKSGFGGEPMRLSVAQNLQPQLAKARSDAEKLRKQKALLLRHNKQLLLELSRLQAAAHGGYVIPPEQADHQAASANGTMIAEVHSWPPQAQDLVKLRKEHEELKVEFRSQAKELRSAQKRNNELEARAEQVESQAGALEVLRHELMPLITSLKRDAAEEKIWDDAATLRHTATVSIQAGIPEHRVAHLITRAREIDATSPRARAARTSAGSPYAAYHSAYKTSVKGAPDPQHQNLHDGLAFVAGASSPHVSPRRAQRAAGASPKLQRQSSAEKLRKEVGDSRAPPEVRVKMRLSGGSDDHRVAIVLAD